MFIVNMYTLKPMKSNQQLLAREYDFSIGKTVSNASDNYVKFKNDPNISNSQCTITCQPTLEYCEAKFFAKLRLKVVASRTMVEPGETIIQSPPYVLSCDNFTVPPGSINNLITKLQVNTPDGTYVHENNNSVQRQVETLINFMQYDQKKLNKEFGIYLHKDIDPLLDYKTVFGKGVFDNVKLATKILTTIDYTSLNLYGFKNMMFEKYPWVLDRNSKYCVLDKEQQLTSSNYVAGQGVNIVINGTGINGYGQFASISNGEVTQTAYIDVYEYLMAPFLSTGYKDNNQMDKILTTSNSVMNIALNFDTNYLRNMVKVASDITISSIDIVEFELHNVHLFSAQPYKQALINKYELKNQTLCYTHDVSYTPDIRVPNVSIGQVPPSKTTVSFTKTAQNVLSKYYLLACPLNVTQNNTTQKLNSVKDIIFSNISNLKFEVTSKSTQYVLQNISNDELVKMTSEVLQNDDFWLEYLDKKRWVNTPLVTPVPSTSLPSPSNNLNLYYGNASNALNLSGTGWAAMRRQNLSFFILDIEKLCLGTIAGIPISPGIRYDDLFTVKFTYDVDNSFNINDYPQLMYGYAPGQTYVANPLCVPITLNIGRVNSAKQFELIPDQMISKEYADKYTELLDNASYKITSANLQFGGGFFGDLWNDIKNVASTVGSVAEHVVPIIDKVAGGRRLYKRSL